MDSLTPPPKKPNKFRKYLSPDALKAALTSALERFPFTCAYIIFSGLYIISLLWFDIDNSETLAAFSFSLSIGLLLSLCISQWGVYFGADKKKITIAQIAGVVLMVLNFFYINNFFGHMGVSVGIRYGVVYVALAVGVLFLPPFVRTVRAQEWNYTTQWLTVILIAWCISIVLSIFSAVVLGTLFSLFGFHNDKVFFTLVIPIYTLFALIVLSFIPKPERSGEVPPESSVGGNFAFFILLPLLLIYTAILYVYGLKTLIELELPRASICAMVTGLTAVVIATIYGLRGVQLQPGCPENRLKITNFVLKWLPISMLPLLVLMSVSILYRMGQYGITPNRLYMLTFNLWAYAMMLYLAFGKQSRMSVVAGSFALVFAITSIFPRFNYYEIGRECVRSHVRALLIEAGAESLPISYKELLAVAAKLPEDKLESLAKDIEWLDDYDNHSGLNGLVKHGSRISSWDIKENTKTQKYSLHLDFGDKYESIDIPEGSRSMQYLNSDLETEPGPRPGLILFKLKSGETFPLNLDTLTEYESGTRKNDQPLIVSSEDGQNVCIIYSLRYYESDTDIWIQGYCFKK